MSANFAAAKVRFFVEMEEGVGELCCFGIGLTGNRELALGLQRFLGKLCDQVC